MSNMVDLDRVRGAALDRIERSERNYKLAFFAAVGVESLFLIGFVLLADFSNRIHVLLLVAAVATYTILALGMMALGAHVSRNTRLILKSLDTIGEQFAIESKKQR